jgi:hypothetical protein
MIESAELKLNSPISNLILDALSNKKIVHLSNLGWVYLAKPQPARNPMTGEMLPPQAGPVIKFVSEGVNTDCKGDHAEFLKSQTLPIVDIKVPEIETNQDPTKEYTVLEPTGVKLLQYRVFERVSNDSEFFHKTPRFTFFGGEFKVKMKALPPFIQEEFDFDSPQTPEDSDNVRPRFSKLTLI